MTFSNVFNEVLKFFCISNDTHDGTGRILAKEKLTYEECEEYLPLRDGDVVFCPSCYDGDSFRLTWIDHRGNKSRIMGRLSGVDTPEMRGSSDKEKALALKAKQRLSDVVAGRFVTIRNPGHDKFGRALCYLQTEKLASVSEYMIADPEICRPYHGGKKLPWD
ncbi:unnamed protein product [Ectocarpus sp. 6 AP-2014]